MDVVGKLNEIIRVVDDPQLLEVLTHARDESLERVATLELQLRNDVTRIKNFLKKERNSSINAHKKCGSRFVNSNVKCKEGRALRFVLELQQEEIIQGHDETNYRGQPCVRYDPANLEKVRDSLLLKMGKELKVNVSHNDWNGCIELSNQDNYNPDLAPTVWVLSFILKAY